MSSYLLLTLGLSVDKSNISVTPVNHFLVGCQVNSGINNLRHLANICKNGGKYRSGKMAVNGNPIGHAYSEIYLLVVQSLVYN